MAKATLLWTGLMMATALAYGTSALAMDPRSVEKERQAYFHALGKPSKALREALNSPVPDLAFVRAQLALIVAAAPGLTSQFPAGSGPQPGLKTEVSPEIWSNPARFSQANAEFQASVAILNQTAQRDDVPALRAAMQATGQTCKACHTVFRKDKP